MASSLLAARAGNKFLSSLLEEKLLSFNSDKSVCIVVGDTEEARQMKTELNEHPMPLGNDVMKRVTQYLYLGVTLDEGRAAASAAATIDKRSS